MIEVVHSHFLSIGKNVFPILTKPLPDELLSSWIVRYARNLRTKSHTFCKFVLSTENVWNRDIDLNVSEAFLKELSIRAFLKYEDVYNTSLKSFYPNLSVEQQRKWVVPIRIYHRMRKGAGLAICPRCLRNDKIPYYRKHWRLSLSVICPYCATELIDRCPKCGSPIAFHRLEVGKKESLSPIEISNCFNCSFDLRRSPCRVANRLVVDTQKKFYSILDRGYSESLQYSHLYFDGIHQLMRIVDSRITKLRQFDKELCARSGLIYSEEMSMTEFDKKDVAKRLATFRKICWLLQQWPERFIEIINATNTFSSYLLKDIKNPPYWYWKLVMENAYVVYSEWRLITDFPNLNSYSAYGISRVNRAGKTSSSNR